MPAVIPFIPLIAAGIAGGTTAGVAIAQNRSNNRATAAQLSAANSSDAITKEANDRAFGLQQEQTDYERWLQGATAQARQPYIDALSQALGVGGNGGYNPTPYQAPSPYTPQEYTAAQPFQAPSREAALNDPGYQFTLGQGQQAIEHGASARGTLLTGGTAKDLAQFTEDAASTQYDKVYARAQGEYGENEATRQAAYDRNNANAFNAYSLNSQNAYNAANLNNQSQYNAAQLGLSAYGQRLSALGTLAGLASPGQYPGAQGGRTTMPLPVDSRGVPIGHLPWSPGMQASGGDGSVDNRNYANGIQQQFDPQSDPWSWYGGSSSNTPGDQSLLGGGYGPNLPRR
jgi:hypothetical protein